MPRSIRVRIRCWAQAMITQGLRGYSRRTRPGLLRKYGATAYGSRHCGTKGRVNCEVEDTHHLYIFTSQATAAPCRVERLAHGMAGLRWSWT